MQEDLRSLMIANSAIAALCGTRVYWGEMPQGASLPNIVLHMISNNQKYTHAGPDDLEASRVQCNLYGETYATTEALSRVLKKAISGIKAQEGNTNFEGIFFEGRRDQRLSGVSDSGVKFLISTDLLIHHKEA